eukprot:SAG31_NODE_5696_length_2376_cov_1.384717_3_plen_277_part_00
MKSGEVVFAVDAPARMLYLKTKEPGGAQAWIAAIQSALQFDDNNAAAGITPSVAASSGSLQRPQPPPQNPISAFGRVSQQPEAAAASALAVDAPYETTRGSSGLCIEGRSAAPAILPGDSVDVFSRSQGLWFSGICVQVEGEEAECEYFILQPDGRRQRGAKWVELSNTDAVKLRGVGVSITASGPLGMRLGAEVGIEGHPCITKIHPGGTVQKFPQVQVGMRLLAIDGSRADNFEQAMRMVKAASRPVSCPRHRWVHSTNCTCTTFRNVGKSSPC